MASLRRLWNVLRRARMDDELRQEVETHLALLEEEERANGSTVEQARYAARSRFGNPVSYREQALDGVVARWLENAWQDARFAVRQLRKAPGFTIPVVLSLALGIGANTAIFTLIDAVLLKSLPLADPAGLVLLGNAREAGVGSGMVGSFSVYSHDLYKHLQQTDVFERLCAVQSSSLARVSVRHAGSSIPQPAASKLVSGNYFEVLGVQAAMGRTLAPSDDSPAAPPVAVISFRYWQERLNGQPSAIGSTVDLNGASVAIIGVTPPEFYGETLRSDPPSFWLPISADRHLDPQRSVIDAPDQHWLYLLGRLQPNVSVAQGQSRLTAALQSWLFAREGSTISDRRRQGIASSHVELTPGGSGVRHMQRSYAQTLRLLLGISAAVLLITCANIANLLLARSAARRAESSLRLALGASRGRLLRQSLTESLTLALAGGALALLAAQAVTQLLLFLVFGAEYVPIRTAPDVRVFAFTFGLSCVAALVFGLLPAMRMSAETASAIKTTSRGVRGSVLARRGLGLGTALIIGEVAIALVLLAGAGSFARSLANLSGQGFGFDREQVLVVGVDPALARYDYSRLGPLYQQMHDRVSALPGVKSASLSRYSPFNGCCWAYSVQVMGYTPQPRESMRTMLNRVSPRYFETLGTKVLRGRAVDEHDTPGSPRVAVVNEAFVGRFFASGDPIGRRFGIDSDDGTPGDIEIVGVVENAKYDEPREEPIPMAFLPLLQVASAESAASDDSVFVSAIQVRSVGDPAAMTGQVRQALADIDPNLAVLSAGTLSGDIDRVLNRERVIAELAVFFGLLALLLATVGLYGLMAYMVQRRTGEIGVRIALGARRATVIRMVIREALWQGVIGILVGVPVAFAVTQLVANQLYGVTPTDPTYAAIAAVVLLLCITIAGYLPARRASRIDPIRVLSQE